jgi:hypothetical protein
VTAADLAFEESRQEQTLRGGRFHDFRIRVLALIEDEHLEHSCEIRGTGWKLRHRRGRCRREVREHARVVQELTPRRVAAFRHVSQVLEEKS